MKKSNVILKGILAVLLVLPFIMACGNPVNVIEKEVSVPITYPPNGGDGSEQQIVVTPTASPEPVLSAYGNIGFAIKWAPVVATERYQVWRQNAGEDPVRVDKNDILTGVPAYLQKGYYTFIDVVDYMDDGLTPTLASDGSYTYTVVAIPYVDVLDSNRKSVGPISHSIAAPSTHVASISAAALKVDGEARAFVLDLNMGGDAVDALKFPGNFSLTLYKVAANGTKTVVTNVTKDPSSAVTYEAGATKTVKWTANTVGALYTNWDTQSAGDYLVEAAFAFTGGVTNNYFDTDIQSVKRTYKNVFNYTDYPKIELDDLPALSGDWEQQMLNPLQEGAAPSTAPVFGTAVTWKGWDRTVSEVDKTPNPVPLVDGGYQKSLEPKVAAFSKALDLRNVRGIPGSTYIVKRKVGDGTWAEVQLYKRWKNTPASVSNQVFWVKNDATADKLIADRYGNITPFQIVYDREVPISKPGTTVTYRLIGTDSDGNVDWIERAFTTDVTVAGRLEMAITAANSNSGGDGNLTTYRVTPTWALNTTFTSYDPDQSGTIAGLIGDNDQVIIRYVRVIQGDKGQFGVENESEVKISMKNLWLDSFSVPFSVGNAALHNTNWLEDDVIQLCAEMYLTSEKLGTVPIYPVGWAKANLDTSDGAYATMAASWGTNGSAGAAFLGGANKPNVVIDTLTYAPPNPTLATSYKGGNYYVLNYPIHNTAAILFYQGSANDGQASPLNIANIFDGEPTTEILLFFTDYAKAGQDVSSTDPLPAAWNITKTTGAGTIVPDSLVDTSANTGKLTFNYITEIGTVGEAYNITVNVQANKDGKTIFAEGSATGMTRTFPVSKRAAWTPVFTQDGSAGVGESKKVIVKFGLSAGDVIFGTTTVSVYIFDDTILPDGDWVLFDSDTIEDWDDTDDATGLVIDIEPYMLTLGDLGDGKGQSGIGEYEDNDVKIVVTNPLYPEASSASWTGVEKVYLLAP